MKEERQLQEQARCGRRKQAKDKEANERRKDRKRARKRHRYKSKQVAREEWELQRLRGRLLRFWASFLSLQKAALGTTGCAK